MQTKVLVDQLYLKSGVVVGKGRKVVGGGVKENLKVIKNYTLWFLVRFHMKLGFHGFQTESLSETTPFMHQKS